MGDLLMRILFVLALTISAAAQPTAVSLPFTDTFAGTAGPLSSNWTPVIGPANSIALIQGAGFAVPAKASGYGVEMFTGASGATGLQGAITFVQSNYSAICFQDSTGKGLCLIPVQNAIVNMVGNSGAPPGGVACTGTSPVKTGDTFNFTISGTTYTATDVTTGKAICSVVSTFVGTPSIQTDWRGKTGTDKIGPVTILGPPPTVNTITFTENLTVNGKAVSATCTAPVVVAP